MQILKSVIWLNFLENCFKNEKRCLHNICLCIILCDTFLAITVDLIKFGFSDQI